jgi:hypothetical protein
MAHAFGLPSVFHFNYNLTKGNRLNPETTTTCHWKQVWNRPRENNLPCAKSVIALQQFAPQPFE